MVSQLFPKLQKLITLVRATDLMWLRHRHSFLHQQLDDFIVVGVSSQDDGSDVRGEVRELLVQ